MPDLLLAAVGTAFAAWLYRRRTRPRYLPR